MYARFKILEKKNPFIHSYKCKNFRILFLDFKGCSIEEISQRRSYVAGTIIGHLCDALKKGNELNFKLLGTSLQDVEKVVSVIRGPTIKSNISTLSAIKDLLPVQIGWGTLRFIIVMLEIHYGCTQDVQLKSSRGSLTDASSSKTMSSTSQVRIIYVTYMSEWYRQLEFVLKAGYKSNTRVTPGMIFREENW